MFVTHKWSTGLNPTVFQEPLQVNLEPSGEGVVGDTGGDGKTQTDTDEYKRSD